MSTQKETKHTPGKWRITEKLSGSENDKGFTLWADTNGKNSGTLWLGDLSPIIDNARGDASGQARANARLIAAAPELYAELFRALAVIRNPESFDVEGVCWDIQAALTKAEEGQK